MGGEGEGKGDEEHRKTEQGRGIKHDADVTPHKNKKKLTYDGNINLSVGFGFMNRMYKGENPIYHS